jgi:hypothetical protein
MTIPSSEEIRRIVPGSLNCTKQGLSHKCMRCPGLVGRIDHQEDAAAAALLRVLSERCKAFAKLIGCQSVAHRLLLLELRQSQENLRESRQFLPDEDDYAQHLDSSKAR